MAFTTVGEVIDALSEFDRSLPIVKADPATPGYLDIILTDRCLFKIVPVAVAGYDTFYRDSTPNEAGGFQAVVL